MQDCIFLLAVNNAVIVLGCPFFFSLLAWLCIVGENTFSYDGWMKKDFPFLIFIDKS